jgi:hypothetical protein
MPSFLKKISYFIPVVMFLCLTVGFHGWATASEGIDHYYVRYDVKSSKNQITDARLTMVPADNEYRAENFSLSKVSGVISSHGQESKESMEKRVKENALKNLLKNKGLKSVKSQNHDTIVSYEGVVITPMDISILAYDAGRVGYGYRARIQFSPIAFPDQWENLNFNHTLKEFFHDFFMLFK